MKIFKYIGEIELISGLHIGGGDDTMKIGGISNSVIKNTNTNLPYIPGSSIKGKMRSLLEWNLGLVGIGDGNPFSPKFLDSLILKEDEEKEKKAKNLLKLFGTNIDKKDEEAIEKLKLDLGITRISIGDCQITKEIETEYSNEKIKLSESKYENVIDRRNGTAKHPRQTERVPAGIKFDFDIRLKVIDGDNEEELKALVERGLDLVANDYLGGNGSRGYGRVKFSSKNDEQKWQEI